MNSEHSCPPHLSDVATLPWEIQTSHFQQYYEHVYSLGQWIQTEIVFTTD